MNFYILPSSTLAKLFQPMPFIFTNHWVEIRGSTTALVRWLKNQAVVVFFFFHQQSIFF